MNKEQAKELTLALFLSTADNNRQIGGFLAQTGIAPNEIRHHIHDASFLAAFLDYLMAFEPALIEACEKAEIDPKDIRPIRQALAPFDIMS